MQDKSWIPSTQKEKKIISVQPLFNWLCAKFGDKSELRQFAIRINLY